MKAVEDGRTGSRGARVDQAYINGEIAMEQSLKVESGLADIANRQTSLQIVLAQSDRIRDPELIFLPLRGCVLGQHLVRESKIQLHGGIALAVR